MSVYFQGAVNQLDEKSINEINQYIERANTVHELNPEYTETFNVTLGTYTLEHGVRLSVMGILEDSSFDAIYMQTNLQSQKIKNISHNNTVEISITNGRGALILECDAMILEDNESKKKYWEDWFYGYHKEGPTAQNYVILKLIPKTIRVFI